MTPESRRGYAGSRFNAYGGQALWFPVMALVAFGLLFVYSSSSVFAEQKFGDDFIFVRKQLMFLIPAAMAALAGAMVPLRILDRFAPQLFLGAVAFTSLTLVPGIGHEVGGGKRWIALAGYQLQPGEFLKVAAVLFAAHILGKHPRRLLLLWPLGAAPVILLCQPDFGTTMILLVGLTAIIFVHGLPLRFFFSGLAVALPLIMAIMMAAPYRMRRLTTFLDPFADPLGAGFQIIQSYVAIANGGLLGKGLGGSQQKLFFLPEAHTDFILSVIAEEMGFAGVLVIVSTYGLLFVVITFLVTRLTEHRDRLICVGLFGCLAASAVVNMGVVTGMFPTKGLPLPFISSGGSALIANSLAIGIIAQIHRNAVEKRRSQLQSSEVTTYVS